MEEKERRGGDVSSSQLKDELKLVILSKRGAVGVVQGMKIEQYLESRQKRESDPTVRG